MVGGDVGAAGGQEKPARTQLASRLKFALVRKEKNSSAPGLGTEGTANRRHGFHQRSQPPNTMARFAGRPRNLDTSGHISYRTACGRRDTVPSGHQTEISDNSCGELLPESKQTREDYIMLGRVLSGNKC